jgi:D-inositol-3-phosphate glycosyltransferase
VTIQLIPARIRSATRSVLRRLRPKVVTIAPFGCIDLGETIAPEVVLVHGWVLSPDDPVVTVLVIVDGTAHVAQIGRERPDVADVHGKSLPVRFSGWAVPVEMHDFDGRDIAIRAEVVLDSGRTEVFGETSVRCEPNPRAYFLPISDVSVDEKFLAVSGIALMEELVARVEIFFDGKEIERARLNAFPTPDLASPSMPCSAVASFTASVDLRSSEPGTRHILSGTAIDVHGNRLVLDPVSIVLTESSAEWPSDTLRSTFAVAPNPPLRGDSVELRVVVVAHNLGIGGGQLYLQELLRQLVARRPMRLLVFSEADGDLRHELERMGAEVHIVGLCPFGDPVAYESLIAEMRARVTGFGAQVCIANTMGTAFGVDLANRIGIPSLLAVHESFPLDEYFIAARGNFAVHPYVRETLRAALRDASALVFESRATQELLGDVIDADRSLLIPYGIDTAAQIGYSEEVDRAELRTAFGIDADTIVFLCVGVFEARKGQAMLANAFALATGSRRDVVLFLIGARDDPYSVAVKDAIRGLRMNDRIRVIPVVGDLRPWYSVADVLVSASDIESMPRSMMEAMAFGLPVLAADAPGVAELVDPGVTGWLCPTRDLDALSRAISEVLDVDAATLRTMGRAAVDHVVAHHDSSGYGDAFASLLESVVPDRGSIPGQ